MSYSNAIGSVSNTLRRLLSNMQDTTVTILPPDQSNVLERRLNLFLYKVTENAYLKNKDWFVNPSNPSELMAPPLSLNLHYLVTPYAPVDDDNIRAAHDMLGEAMRILHENTILPENLLDLEGLENLHEQIKVSQEDLDMDELGKIWGAFDVPYRLSVGYEVSVVQIDPIPETPTLMPPRVQGIGGINVGSAANLPKNLELLEQRVRPGDTLTIVGEFIDGWQAYVRLGNRFLLDGELISGGGIAVTLPPDTNLGFQNIRVDVSGLFRATFSVEVHDD